MIPSQDSNLYSRLRIGQNATQEEIRKSYLQMAKKWHPDLNSSARSHVQFLAISEAFEILSDSERKTQYDLSLRPKEKINENSGFDFRDYCVQPNWDKNFRRVRKEKTASKEKFERILRENFFFYNSRNRNFR